jgi:hypothetical protein
MRWPKFMSRGAPALPTPSPPEAPVSKRLLQQRVRNRIIEYLGTAASAEEQREYERDVPIAQVPNEMINQWEDWIPDGDLDWFSPPVFSPEESEAIRSFHKVWLSVADETPNPMPHSIELILGTPAWNRLMDAAHLALSVFEKRGYFDEDVELQFES